MKPKEIVEEPSPLLQAKKIVDATEGPVVESTKSTTIFEQNDIEPAIKVEHPQVVFTTKKSILRSHQLIWYIVTIIEILLFFRFFFKAIGANPQSIFGNFTYTITYPIALPFLGLVKSTIINTNIFEWSTLIAMVIYMIFSWIISYLFTFITPVTPEEVEDKV